MAQSFLSYDAVSQPGFKGQFNYAPVVQAPKMVTNNPVDVSQNMKGVSSPVNGYNVGNFASALGGALNKVIAQPAVKIVRPTADLFTGQGSKAVTDAGTLVHDVAKVGSYTGLSPLANKLSSQIKYLGGPASTAAQRSALVNNQKAAATNPAFTSATQGLDLRNNSIAGVNQAQAIAHSGSTAAQIRTVLQQDQHAVANNNKTAIGSFGTLASMGVGAPEAKALGTAAKEGVGAFAKRAGVDTLIGAGGNAAQTLANNPNATGKQLAVAGGVGGGLGALAPVGGKLLSPIAKVFSKGAKDFLGKSIGKDSTQALVDSSGPKNIPVRDMSNPTSVNVRTPTKIGIQQESSTTRIPVTTPVRAGVKDISTTDKINVRTPQQMSDGSFTKQFNTLSKNYERDQASLEKLPPVQAKVMQDHLETSYQTKLQNLHDSYNNPELSKPVAPKSIDRTTTAAPKNTGGKDIAAPKTLSSSISKAEKNTGGKTAVEASRTVNSSVDSHVAPIEDRPPKNAPKEPTIQLTTTKTEPTTGPKVSGSAIRTESEAVQNGMKGEFEGKTQYNSVSHKAEADKAVQLLHDDPVRARQIAMGERSGDNVSHEAAVYHAVKNQALEDAKKTGDYSEVQRLASSDRHTTVSEAAQKLSAEGYNIHKNDPVEIMKQVVSNRKNALEKKAGTTVEKEAVAIGKTVKATVPKVSRQDWHSFVDSLRCD